jgi:hypothetical protein
VRMGEIEESEMGVTPLIPGMIFQGPSLNNRETGVVILQHTQAKVHARAYIVSHSDSRKTSLLLMLTLLMTLVHWM